MLVALLGTVVSVRAVGRVEVPAVGLGLTTLLSALTAVANNPVVKRLGKKAAKQAVDKVADFAKSMYPLPLDADRRCRRRNSHDG